MSGPLRLERAPQDVKYAPICYPSLCALWTVRAGHTCHDLDVAACVIALSNFPRVAITAGKKNQDRLSF